MKLFTIRFIFIALFLSFSSFTAQAAGTIQLPATGQTSCWDQSGNVLTSCAGTGQDGDVPRGAVWPVPRFTENLNSLGGPDGTVTDNLTGLIWLKNANCTDIVGNIDKLGGRLAWQDALTWSNALASGACGLSDGSAVGAWRLPNRTELESLINLQETDSSVWLNLPNQKFSNVQSAFYWSSSTYALNTFYAWYVYMYGGDVNPNVKTDNYYVWPVRAGQ
jgi:hypothetical protein